MTYQIRCTACSFERTVDELEAALAFETAHTDEVDDDHLVDIELIE